MGWEWEAAGPRLGSLLSREHVPLASLLGIVRSVRSRFRESTLSSSPAGVSAEGGVPIRDPSFPYCWEVIVLVRWLPVVTLPQILEEITPFCPAPM